MTEPTGGPHYARFVILDTLPGSRPLWRLFEQRGTLPAELDHRGEPVPEEEARLVLWVTRTCAAEISLRRISGRGHLYQVVEH